jgi:hypothetical protein
MFDKGNMPGTREEFLCLINKILQNQFGALGDKTFARLLGVNQIRFRKGARAGQGKEVWAQLFPEHY